MPLVLAETKYQQVKDLIAKNKDKNLKSVAQKGYVSLRTAYYIKGSKNYEDYRKQVTNRNSKKKEVEAKPEPKVSGWAKLLNWFK